MVRLTNAVFIWLFGISWFLKHVDIKLNSSIVVISFSALHYGRLMRTTCCERPLNSSVTHSVTWWVEGILKPVNFSFLLCFLVWISLHSPKTLYKKSNIYLIKHGQSNKPCYQLDTQGYSKQTRSQFLLNETTTCLIRNIIVSVYFIYINRLTVIWFHFQFAALGKGGQTAKLIAVEAKQDLMNTFRRELSLRLVVRCKMTTR